MFVRAKMTAKPLTASPDLSILDASDLMRSNDVKRLPVVENGKLVGIVSRSDIQQYAPSKATSLSVFEMNYLLAKATVRDAMVADPVTVDAGAMVEEAAVIMREHNVQALPVMENGQLVGIITETDIFDAFIEIVGFKDPGSRLAVRVTDEPGMLSKVAGIVGAQGVNISHASVFRGQNGMSDMVLRVNTKNLAPLAAALEEAGLQVL